MQNEASDSINSLRARGRVMMITVVSPVKVDVVEDDFNEFKVSMFCAPNESIPGVRQMGAIAKTIAGFINAKGGTLWLGVDNEGVVSGLARDLNNLGSGAVPSVRGPTANDDGFTYGYDLDQYELKLRV